MFKMEENIPLYIILMQEIESMKGYLRKLKT